MPAVVKGFTNVPRFGKDWFFLKTHDWNIEEQRALINRFFHGNPGPKLAIACSYASFDIQDLQELRLADPDASIVFYIFFVEPWVYPDAEQ